MHTFLPLFGYKSFTYLSACSLFSPLFSPFFARLFLSFHTLLSQVLQILSFISCGFLRLIFLGLSSSSHYSLTHFTLSGQFSSFATHRYLLVLGNIHNIDLFFHTNSLTFSQIMVLFLYPCGLLFHLSWCGNLDFFVTSSTNFTLNFIPLGIAYHIFDPHFTLSISSVYNSVVVSTSGIYNIFFGLKFLTLDHLSMLSPLFLCICLSGYLCSQNFINLTLFPQVILSCDYFGTLCFLWSLHSIVVILPFSWGEKTCFFLSNTFFEVFFSGIWSQLATLLDSNSHIYGTFINLGSTLLDTSVSTSNLSGSTFSSFQIHHHTFLAILSFFIHSVAHCITFGLSHTS